MAKALSVLFVAASVAGSLTVGPDHIPVSGHVRDESGAPIRGAAVECLLVSTDKKIATVTDEAGSFLLDVPQAPTVSITAAHSDFGVQWTGGHVAGVTPWTAYRYFGEVPAKPVELVLRKGVVLHGRASDTKGTPFAGQDIFLVPAYIGSGPSQFAATADARGQFSFPRAVLTSNFELVPRALHDWRPRTPGQYLRTAQTADRWLAAARDGKPIELVIESYTLVPVTLNVSALRTRVVEVWTRRAKDGESATALQVDQSGHVQIVMEQGAPHELWAFPGVLSRLGPPPSRSGRPADWTGTPIGPAQITIKPR